MVGLLCRGTDGRANLVRSTRRRTAGEAGGVLSSSATAAAQFLAVPWSPRIDPLPREGMYGRGSSTTPGECNVSVFRTKSVEQSMRDTEEPDHRLKKELSALDLTFVGGGVIIGTGIFVLTGVAANTTAGPAVALSFVVAAIACGLAALCYAELASTVPVAG